MSRPSRGMTRRLSGKPAQPWQTYWSGTAVVFLGALAMLLPLTMTTGTTAGSPASARRADIPGPLLYSRGFADPTVVESRVGLVGAATAPDLNIGRSPADS